jgi:SAM-dependent methyltransferase
LGASLPKMEGWDEVFDETYLRTYMPFLDERAEDEALAAVALAGVTTGAEVLDCPCGFGRHALVLARDGYRVTGVDRSEVQLAEAERRRGDAEWPWLVRADYRELPFADASFDAVLNLFTSLGYLDREGDVGVLGELRRVLRPRGALVVETMHRDRLARLFTPRVWDPLPDGAVFLQERECDWAAGEISTRHVIVTPEGEQIERRFVHHAYTTTEWVAMLREAGFGSIECFNGLEGEGPASPEARLVVRAR